MSTAKFRILFTLLMFQLGHFASAQVVVFGSAAREDFEDFVTNYEITHIDFEEVSTGPLSTQLQASAGVTFASTISTGGSVISPSHNAYLSSASVNGDNSHKLVGTPFASFGADDGRVGYEIRFDTPQTIAGVLRNWNSSAVTNFYNSEGTLLGAHTNTTNLEFVGWIGDYSDSLTWVSFIELDTIGVGTGRQVGYTDDLFFGIAAIPEPSTFSLLAVGLIVVFSSRTRGRDRGHSTGSLRGR